MCPKVHADTEMPMARTGDHSTKTNGDWGKRIQKFAQKVERCPGLVWQKMWKLGRDDPRRVIHSLKVGISLTLVSLLYLMEPLFLGIGHNAIWAVMTVVLVLEFTVGATLCKGLNRGFGTLLAGSLAFLMEYIADESGLIFRAIFIGAAVFLIGAAATYTRFFPFIKKNYDYGVVIFLLTFNLITVSSYRVENVLKIAIERLYTIAIGCGICLIMTLLIFPNWSGQDLHNSTVSKLERLAKSIEACVKEYFNENNIEINEDDQSSEDPIYEGYKAVLDSKSTDETLALHASWEPRHSRYCHKFPSQQYLKLGAVLRHFCYTVVALHGCLQTEIQAPQSVRALFKDPCIRLAGEVAKVLMELANSIRKRCHCSPEILSDHLQEALKDLNTAITSQPRLFFGPKINQDSNMLAVAAAAHASQEHQKDSRVSTSSVRTDPSTLLERRNRRVSEQSKEAELKLLRRLSSKIAITSLEFSEALPFAAFASLLVEMVAKLDHIIEEVEELGRKACFKEYKHCDQIFVVTSERPQIIVDQNNFPSHGAE